MKQNNFLIRGKQVLNKKSVSRAIRDALKLFFEYSYYRLFSFPREFRFNNKKLKYFYYPYNATWRNERAIEIPIIKHFMRGHRGKEVLELGNVLSHYFSVNHVIIDKYEKAKGVINSDIVDFKPKRKFDLIVAISTLEHIGWDEKPRELLKILKAIKNLKNLLNKNGRIIASVPLGYNSEIDELIRENRIFDEQYFMKRVSKDNKWGQISAEEAKEIEYGKPYAFANGLVIGIIYN